MWKFSQLSITSFVMLGCFSSVSCAGDAFQASGDFPVNVDSAHQDRLGPYVETETDGGSKSESESRSPTVDAGTDVALSEAGVQVEAASLEKPTCSGSELSYAYAPECAPWYESQHFSSETFAGPCCTRDGINQLPRCGAKPRNSNLCL